MTRPRFDFTIHATDGAARTGVIATRRGDIRTPAFMPIGTAATVKAMRPADVRAAGADIILGNTYHLMLRPGAERVARLGGLHKFMGWSGPILTDSGGYQVMSLAARTKRSEEGVAFASHIDGTKHLITPERSIEIQRLLGSDIVMAFDELVALPAEREAVEAAMARSMRWAARSRAAFDGGGEHAAAAALFGIQQGGLDEGLRGTSARALRDIGFDGYAIGGLAVGEGQAAMFGVLDFACDQLPADRAALPDGSRQARRYRRRGPARRRHVRLRAADALGADGAGFYPGGADRDPQRRLRRGPAPARPRLPVPGVRPEQPRLPAPLGP